MDTITGKLSGTIQVTGVLSKVEKLTGKLDTTVKLSGALDIEPLDNSALVGTAFVGFAVLTE